MFFSLFFSSVFLAAGGAPCAGERTQQQHTRRCASDGAHLLVRRRRTAGVPRASGVAWRRARVFYFYIFYFHFLQKYIFVFEIYRNIPRPPCCRRPGPGRPAAGRQGLLCKNFCENICVQFPGGRSPGSGAAGPGRPAAGRPALPSLYKGWLVQGWK